jgi:hypothetical protein
VPIEVAENTVEESVSIAWSNIVVGVADPSCPPVQAGQEASSFIGDPMCQTAVESNRLLERLGDTVENINRVLIGTQRSLIRVSRLVISL